MNAPRHHHYVPQGYLRMFADGLARKARVYTVDREERRAYVTHVRNVAGERDFNRIEADGVDPNALEQAYGEFEGLAAAALQRINDSRTFENPEDRSAVLNLVALLAARNPRHRGYFNRFMSDISKSIMELSLANKERWEGLQKQMEESDPEKYANRPEVTYEEMRDFVRSGDYTIKSDQTYQIGLELQMVDVVLRTLVPRKWVLHVAADTAGDFVTCDHPVCLVPVGWKPPPLLGVGFGMADTAVLFPLGRRLLLSGMFEGEESVRVQGSFGVARLNSQIIQFAERQVYSFDSAFAYARPDGIAKGADLVRDPLFIGDDRKMHR